MDATDNGTERKSQDGDVVKVLVVVVRHYVYNLNLLFEFKDLSWFIPMVAPISLFLKLYAGYIKINFGESLE